MGYILVEVYIDLIYLTGITNLTQLLWAQQEMLGVAADVAAALTGLAVISVVDVTTYSTPLDLCDLLLMLHAG